MSCRRRSSRNLSHPRKESEGSQSGGCLNGCFALPQQQGEKETAEMTGKVERLTNQGGFGSIGAENRREIFLRSSAL